MTNNGVGNWKIFDDIFDSVLVVDRELRLRYANQSFCALSDLTSEAISARESAAEYIELPPECWQPLAGETRYREVGFITKSGNLGRAQVYTGPVQSDPSEELICLVIRDVSVEDRLHAKYKVQVETNEHLVQECSRVAAETAFLRGMMSELPAYADKASMLSSISLRLKTDIGCREVYFFHLAEDGNPMVADRRYDARAKEVARQLEPILRDHRGETVRSAMLEPQGQVWVTFCRPRLERPVVLVVCPKVAAKPGELRPFLESVAGQLSACLDNHAYFFEPLIDADSGLFNKRFFDSRLGIECQRATEKHTALSFLMLDVATKGDGLYTIGQTIKRRLRNADFVARIGENRIGVVLPETSAADSLIVAESLRHAISGLRAVGSARDPVPSIVCGIASYKWTTDTPESLVAAAEQALATAPTEPKAA